MYFVGEVVMACFESHAHLCKNIRNLLIIIRNTVKEYMTLKTDMFYPARDC